MKKCFSLILILVLILTSCSFPGKIADVPKAEEVNMIRFSFAGHNPDEAYGKVFDDSEDIKEILSALDAVGIQYESTGVRYGGAQCSVICYKTDGTMQIFAFSSDFAEYAIAAEDDVSYYNVLSGGDRLADIYDTSDIPEEKFSIEY